MSLSRANGDHQSVGRPPMFHDLINLFAKYSEFVGKIEEDTIQYSRFTVSISGGVCARSATGIYVHLNFFQMIVNVLIK